MKAVRITNTGLVLNKKTTSFVFEKKDIFQYKSFFSDKKLDKNKTLYYIYRNFCLNTDKQLFKKYGVSFDFTLLSKGSIGNEAIRTIGHFHKKSSSKIPYPEIYQVINGKAVFLMQKQKSNNLYAVNANKNTIVIIPPEFGHITVNASHNKPLLVANLFVNKKNLSDYSFFKKNHGPLFYPIWEKNKLVFKKNLKYHKSSALITLNPAKKLPFGIKNKTPLYDQFIKTPAHFSFLTNPHKYIKQLNKII